jgi:hypothetical protein
VQFIFRTRLACGFDLPSGCFDAHAAVSVPGPRLGDEHETVAGIAEALLEEAAQVGGDEVRGGGRVAVVNDARDRSGFARFGPGERLEEGHEILGRVGEQG